MKKILLTILTLSGILSADTTILNSMKVEDKVIVLIDINGKESLRTMEQKDFEELQMLIDGTPEIISVEKKNGMTCVYYIIGDRLSYVLFEDKDYAKIIESKKKKVHSISREQMKKYLCDDER